MKVEKFVAPTMKEALAKVKESLGEDAMILKSEKVKAAGGMNFLKQDLIEITAARAEDVKEDLQTGPDFAETIDSTMSRQQDQDLPPRPRFEISLLKDEIKNLRDELSLIGNHIKYNKLPSMPRELVRFWEVIGESGVDKLWAIDMAQEALVQLSPNELISAEAIEEYLLKQLTRAIQPASNPIVRRKAPYKIALIGPPGAGKTTTLQKLATDPAAYGKRKIGLISLDTHRMAAIEQIKTYARIAGTALEVVFQPEQIPVALSRLSSCEIILIDTAGCSPRDSERLMALREFIDKLDPDEIHLVLNCTIRDEELNFTCEKYREVGVSHLSFTRLDEALHRGYLVNIARSAQKPVAWLGTGQGFTGHIERYVPELLRSWVLQPGLGEVKPIVTRLRPVEQA